MEQVNEIDKLDRLVQEKSTLNNHKDIMVFHSIVFLVILFFNRAQLFGL